MEIGKLASEENLGKYSTEARMIMYERTAVPAITYNLEVWTRLRESDWKRLEKIQSEALKNLLQLPKSTPYLGMLKEVSVWPMRDRINYHRMMLLQDIVQSDKERLGKKIVESQKKDKEEESWYSETEEVCQSSRRQI